ncbi:hypothetical protein ASG43_20225 [Aureimonas sp. Leaf454]|uniref:ATP-binding protein n=1 Tax=Aureimonas sp. Leaf454 TaxID=1736381 RepID=UPI0006FC1381|nr:ATP-binding protein [Aureimonas sp. Leaf454]KQT52382.1 hypothetical protein ASG43_20225 [Aureimonas sp. Leaf454]
MTTRTRPSPIDILADIALCEAVEAGAAVAVFDRTLDHVLFADAAMRPLVGDATTSPSATLRQIRSSVRMLNANASARVLLRLPTRAGTRMSTADIALRPDLGDDGVALLTIDGFGQGFDADDILAFSSPDDGSAAVFSGDERRAATPSFSDEAIPDLAERVRAFAAASERSLRDDDGRARLSLSRAPFGRIVVRIAPSERPRPEAAETPDDRAASAVPDRSPAVEARPAPTGFSSFSVKRPKLGAPRTGLSVAALLQRWHAQEPDAASKAAGSSTDHASPHAEPSPAASTDGEADVAPIVAAEPATDLPEAGLPEVGLPEVGLPNLGWAEDGPQAAGVLDPVPDEAGMQKPPLDTAEPAPAASSIPGAAASVAAAPAPRQRSNWGATTAVPPQAVIAPPSDEEPSRDDASAADEPATPERPEPAVAEAGTASQKPADLADGPGLDLLDAVDPAVGVGPLRDVADAIAPEPDLAADETIPSEPASDDAADRSAMPENVPLADDEPAVPAEPPAPAPPSGFRPRFDVAPVRFVWQIDRTGAFRFLSPDFATAVGPNAADVVGRSFADVARVFGFDATREIARLLERRDTWSGRTILWPVEGSDRKVPVDLAALPVYGRDRSFDGFRGFGIVRLNESVADDEGLGLHLVGPASPVEGKPTGQARVAEDEASREAVAPREKPFLRRFEAESFGRRAEPPADMPAPPEPASALPAPQDQGEVAPKVIRLEERRRPRDGALSLAEEAAFRAIGVKLGHQAEAESPGALRFEEPGTAQPADDDLAFPPSEEDEAADLDAIDDASPAASEDEAAAGTGIAPPDERDAGEAGSIDADPPAVAFEDALIGPGGEPDPVAEADASLDRADDHDDVPADDEAGVPAPAPAVPTAIEAQDPAEREGLDPDEAASSTPSASPAFDDASGWADEDMAGDDAEAPLDLTVFERLFAGLPLAVLVQVRERPIYVNAEFAVLTGHADAAAVERAGGLDALVLDRRGEGTLALRRADGDVVDVRAHMQRIAEGGRSALLMSFSPAVDEAADAGPALEDLRQEVEELQAVLDTATDGIVLLDMAGNIRAMNGSAHALFGLSAAEAFGRHVSSLFAHESQKATVDYLDMLRDDGIGGILNDGREVIGRVSQGGFIPLFITIGRLSGERGWCVVIRDIAHWKRIEEDLVNARRQAEAASLHKSRFLANISHELRTPLNAIIGFADVMSSECFGPIGNERYLEYLGDIKRSGHHVLDLVNDLLDISKIEAGKIDLSFEAVSLNEVVSEVVSLMQPQANRERVIVRSNLPSSVPPVVADRRTIRQIALNLVANAIRFTPAGGQIIASTTYTAEGDVLLRFRDSGIGMTEREIELALTPFQQVHAPSANRGEGTGLGLPLTKAMVEANRAQFSIQSTPGEGTLVEIAFPAPRVLAD